MLVLLIPQLMDVRKWRTTSCSFPPAKLQPVCNFKSFLLSGLQVSVSKTSSLQKGPKYTQSGTGIFPTAGLYFTSIYEPTSTLLLPSAEPTTFLQNILSQLSSAASKLKELLSLISELITIHQSCIEPRKMAILWKVNRKCEIIQGWSSHTARKVNLTPVTNIITNSYQFYNTAAEDYLKYQN